MHRGGNGLALLQAVTTNPSPSLIKSHGEIYTTAHLVCVRQAKANHGNTNIARSAAALLVFAPVRASTINDLDE